MKYKSTKSEKSNKLNFDKYYTKKEDMKYCVDKTLNLLNELGYEVDSFLEPSAGMGVFSDYLLDNGNEVIAIDIAPESDRVEEADYLNYPLEYKKKRLTIGNPPFGARMSLAKKFYEKSCLIGDYISFILPISQLNNTQSLYKFTLIHSEDLGILTFSGNRKVHCCLNVYVRPKSGELNKIKKLKLKDVEIVRKDSKKYDKFNYDIRMCRWGNGSAGKILQEGESHSSEYKIKINNIQLYNEIYDVIVNTDWKTLTKHTSMCSIKQHHIIEELKKRIPQIK